MSALGWPEATSDVGRLRAVSSNPGGVAGTATHVTTVDAATTELRVGRPVTLRMRLDQRWRADKR